MAMFDRKLVRCAAKLSKKHRVSVTVREKVALSGGYWDGGSRTEWYALDIATGARKPLEYPTAPRAFGGGDVPIVDIPAGVAIVSHGTFCGKEATPRLHVRYLDLPALFGLEFTFADDTPEGIVMDYLLERGIDVR